MLIPSFRLATLLATACLHLSALSAPTVTISEGALVGLSADGIQRFLGIPYAKPPVGQARWRAPQAPQAWPGVRPATQFGASCPQASDLFGPASANEDCLSLNVYAPEAAPAAPRPVIVWVHGGGFRSGAGSYYDASEMARKTDAVVVTINYRLGALGFLTTSGMTGENKAVNFGLQDQYFALGWVKRNIAAFGGDPQRVTLAGQSAGGAAGCLALTSPHAAGLFHRVIMHSAPCSIATAPLAKAQASGDAVAEKLGCAPGPGQMACLRSKSTQDILEATKLITPEETISNSMWPATVDGAVVPSPVLSALSWGRFHRVPVMLGSTLDEGKGLIGWGFHGPFGRAVTQQDYVGAMRNFAGDIGAQAVPALYSTAKYGTPSLALGAALTDIALACPADSVARSLSDHVPTYAFEFADRQAPQFFEDPFTPGGWGAYHAGELLYIFQRPVSGLSMPGLSPSQLALSEQMLRYWRQFVATGNPNATVSAPPPAPATGAMPPRWPRFDRLSAPFLTLDPQGIRTQAFGKFQSTHQCLIWSSLYGMGAFVGAL